MSSGRGGRLGPTGHSSALEVPLSLTVLVTPVANGAFFADVVRVAVEEIRLCAGLQVLGQRPHPTLCLLDLEIRAEQLSDTQLRTLARLACVQAIFERSGDAPDAPMRPVPVKPGWTVPPVLVEGARYRGKTHPEMTRLAIRLATGAATRPVKSVLDPVAGRGTTLLEGVRSGLDAWGVELDPAAREDLRRHVKGTCKVHRIKHREATGWVGPKRPDQVGAFVSYALGETRLKLVTGDGRDIAELLGNDRRFDIIVGDLPYGVQHQGARKRGPDDLLRDGIPAWADRLEPGGALALVFNRLQPRRDVVEDIATGAGLELVATDVAHRMSASIWRDVLLAVRRP